MLRHLVQAAAAGSRPPWLRRSGSHAARLEEQPYRPILPTIPLAQPQDQHSNPSGRKAAVSYLNRQHLVTDPPQLATPAPVASSEQSPAVDRTLLKVAQRSRAATRFDDDFAGAPGLDEFIGI